MINGDWIKIDGKYYKIISIGDEVTRVSEYINEKMCEMSTVELSKRAEVVEWWEVGEPDEFAASRAMFTTLIVILIIATGVICLATLI